MFHDLHAQLPALIAAYGYWLVAGVIALESMGLPLPGETTLIAASIYAGNTHNLNIALVILVAAAGAILGDNVGFWIGREAGFPLLLRYGGRIGIGEARIKLGEYMFLKHGGKVVFFGRFVAVLRALAAFLAGANRMEWRRFLVFNAAGGIVWVSLYGVGAYLLGRQIRHLLGPVGLIGLGLALAGLVAGWFMVRRHEAALQAAAERAFPGPLSARHR